MGTYFTVVFPTVQFAVAQDCLWWLNTRPVAENRTILEVGGCFPEDRLSLPDFDARAEPYYDRWERVAKEDSGKAAARAWVGALPARTALVAR